MTGASDQRIHAAHSKSPSDSLDCDCIYSQEASLESDHKLLTIPDCDLGDGVVVIR